jgi:hypothetical protein
MRLLTLLLFLFSLPVQAEMMLYHVEGRLEGVYPASPEAIGTIGSGAYEITEVQAIDEENMVVFKGGYSNKQLMFPEQAIPGVMEKFIQQHTRQLAATVEFQQSEMIDEIPAVRYTLKHSLQDMPARSLFILTYHNNRLALWGVEYLPEISTRDGAFIFQIYSGYFKPL